MATGFISGATDLDSIFAPYTTGTKPAATGYVTGTQDLKDRFAPLSTGSAAAATGFKIAGGADLNTLFAAIGTVNQASLTNTSISAISLTPADASIKYIISPDGKTYQSQNNGVNSIIETWLDAGTASSFELRATLQSGTLSSGTTGVWQNLGTERLYEVVRTDNVVGTNSASILVEIRDANSLALLTSATVNMDAVVDI